jgi:hypothetical protein
MSTVPTYKVYHDTANGRLPFTYMVFGPYPLDGMFDVEVYKGHVEYPADTVDYIGTVSDLTRNTHVVIDVWDWMDANV